MCKKTKKAEFVLAEEPYYCVPAVRSGVTDSSFGKWGQVSIRQRRTHVWFGLACSANTIVCTHLCSHQWTESAVRLRI